MDVPAAPRVTPAPPAPGPPPRPAGRDAVAAALADVARIGPWFAVGTAPEATRRWDDLYLPVTGDGPDPLAARIDQVAASLGTGRRIAASIAVQGMAARLVSMPFATVALHGVLPRLDGLRREPAAADPWAPSLPDRPAAVVTPDPRTDPHGAAGVLAAELATTHLEPLYAAVTARVSVSERVLRGNVVSAIAGAAKVMEAVRRADRPAFLPLLAALVGHPALRGPLPEPATGTVLRLDDADPDSEWGFRRRSCCLYVRVPGGGTCGDCVLTGSR